MDFVKTCCYIYLMYSWPASAVLIVPREDDVCDMNACDVLSRIRQEISQTSPSNSDHPAALEVTQEMRISKIERRLRAVEQPGTVK